MSITLFCLTGSFCAQVCSHTTAAFAGTERNCRRGKAAGNAFAAHGLKAGLRVYKGPSFARSNHVEVRATPGIRACAALPCLTAPSSCNAKQWLKRSLGVIRALRLTARYNTLSRNGRCRLAITHFFSLRVRNRVECPSTVACPATSPCCQAEDRWHVPDSRQAGRA